MLSSIYSLYDNNLKKKMDDTLTYTSKVNETFFLSFLNKKLNKQRN